MHGLLWDGFSCFLTHNTLFAKVLYAYKERLFCKLVEYRHVSPQQPQIKAFCTHHLSDMSSLSVTSLSLWVATAAAAVSADVAEVFSRGTDLISPDPTPTRWVLSCHQSFRGGQSLTGSINADHVIAVSTRFPPVMSEWVFNSWFKVCFHSKSQRWFR